MIHSAPITAERLNPIPTELQAGAGRPSAVLVGLTIRDGAWQVIMTVRAHHLTHHAGQISFPGGKVDPEDASLVATALREADEEVALAPSLVEIIGGLDPVTSPVGFVVQPVVGLVHQDAILRAAPDEVAQILVLPLEDLVNPLRHRRDSYIRDGARRQVWVVEHEDHYIWGLSAAILVDLASRIRQPHQITESDITSQPEG